MDNYNVFLDYIELILVLQNYPLFIKREDIMKDILFFK